MQRNQHTTITELQPGDRFYKAGDKNKEVWEFVSVIGKEGWVPIYLAKRDIDTFPTKIRNYIDIIFLRNKN